MKLIKIHKGVVFYFVVDSKRLFFKKNDGNGVLGICDSNSSKALFSTGSKALNLYYSSKSIIIESDKALSIFDFNVGRFKKYNFFENSGRNYFYNYSEYAKKSYGELHCED